MQLYTPPPPPPHLKLRGLFWINPDHFVCKLHNCIAFRFLRQPNWSKQWGGMPNERPCPSRRLCQTLAETIREAAGGKKSRHSCFFAGLHSSGCLYTILDSLANSIHQNPWISMMPSQRYLMSFLCLHWTKQSPICCLGFNVMVLFMDFKMHLWVHSHEGTQVALQSLWLQSLNQISMLHKIYSILLAVEYVTTTPLWYQWTVCLLYGCGLNCEEVSICSTLKPAGHRDKRNGTT